MFAGLLMSASVTALGAVLAVAGCVGWFREVFPHQHEDVVVAVREAPQVATERSRVERLAVAPDQLRPWLPVQTSPVSAGVTGGLAGRVAMAVLAVAYGVLRAGSIWYPINLLAATVYSESLKFGSADLYAFHASSFATALFIHGLVSILVGLL